MIYFLMHAFHVSFGFFFFFSNFFLKVGDLFFQTGKFCFYNVGDRISGFSLGNRKDVSESDFLLVRLPDTKWRTVFSSWRINYRFVGFRTHFTRFLPFCCYRFSCSGEWEDDLLFLDRSSSSVILFQICIYFSFFAFTSFPSEGAFKTENYKESFFLIVLAGLSILKWSGR